MKTGYLSIRTPAMKVCIATPDIVGPVKTGGIGTHCFHLARLLAENGIDTTILFTGPVSPADFAKWQVYYRKMGIAFHALLMDPSKI